MVFNLSLEHDQGGDNIRAVRMHDERDFTLESIIKVDWNHSFGPTPITHPCNVPKGSVFRTIR